MSRLDDDYVPDPPTCDGDGSLHIPDPVRGCHSFHDGPHFWCWEGDCPGCPNCEPEAEEVEE